MRGVNADKREGTQGKEMERRSKFAKETSSDGYTQ